MYQVYLIPDGISGAGLILHEWPLTCISLRDSITSSKCVWVWCCAKFSLCHPFSFSEGLHLLTLSVCWR